MLTFVLDYSGTDKCGPNENDYFLLNIDTKIYNFTFLHERKTFLLRPYQYTCFKGFFKFNHDRNNLGSIPGSSRVLLGKYKKVLNIVNLFPITNISFLHQECRISESVSNPRALFPAAKISTWYIFSQYAMHFNGE